MIFSTENPDSERAVLILCNGGDFNYLIQGQFYIEEDDYYDWQGELLDEVISWAELPVIE